MCMPFRFALPLVLLVLAACSSKIDQPAVDPAVAPATVPVPATTPAPAAVAVVQGNEQKCTNEPPTDENDKRPRCGGVGTVSPAPSHAYRIDFAQCPGGGRESMRACDVSKPFTVTACGGMASITHTPTSDRGGTWTFRFQGGGGFADSSGTYTLSGPEESMTEHVVGNKVCAHAAGRTVCAAPRPSTATWVKIDDCK